LNKTNQLIVSKILIKVLWSTPLFRS